MKQYDGMNIKDIRNEEDRRITEIARRIYEEYAYGDKQLHSTLGIALKIENWCKENFEKKKTWERRLPSTQSEDRFEAEIGVNLKCIRRRIKQYEGKDIAEIEDEDDKRIVDIIRTLDKDYAYGDHQLHKGLGVVLEIESWCKENNEEKSIWERRLPSARAKDKYEKEIGKKINGIRGKIKKYTEMDLVEIEDEDDKKIVEIIRRLDEEYAYGDSQLHSNLGVALEIENWCKENNEGKKIWQRKLPRTKCEDKYEKRMGQKLGKIRTRIKQYEGVNIEEIENEEDRQMVEIIRRLDEEFGLGEYLKNTLEIEEWCKENNKDKKIWERKLPSITSKNIYESKLGERLRNIKSKIIKQYEGVKLEQIENEEDRQIVEIIRRLDREYNYKKFKGKDLAKVGFETGITDVKLCDEEDKALQQLVEQMKEGGINKDE